LRIVLIGAGVMGTNHARTVAANRDVELVGIVDPDLERASVLGRAYGAPFAESVAALGVDFDAAIVAAPTPHHHSMALPMLTSGKHVLVEKPLTHSVESAMDLLEAANQAGVVLMVGHVERSNAVVRALPDLVEGLIHIEAFRMGPFSARIADSVVLDLMIHDIDIAIALADSTIARVVAVAQSTQTPTEDLVTALLTFQNGVTAALTASRIGQQKIRELRLTQQGSVLSADLMRNHVEINRVAHIEYSTEGGRSYRQSGVVEIPFIENSAEPLALQLRAFVSQAVAGQPNPCDRRTVGVDALAAAHEIIRAVQSGAR
jgi:predicted dehydrogenase